LRADGNFTNRETDGVSLLESLHDVGVVTSDATSELHVFRHQSDSLGMEGNEIAILEEASQVALRCLLESVQSR
jgi:hypothetical protein